jgi:hypothetical protein
MLMLTSADKAGHILAIYFAAIQSLDFKGKCESQESNPRAIFTQGTIFFNREFLLAGSDLLQWSAAKMIEHPDHQRVVNNDIL